MFRGSEASEAKGKVYSSPLVAPMEWKGPKRVEVRTFAAFSRATSRNFRADSDKARQRARMWRKVMYQEAVAKLTGENLIRAKFDNFIGGKWVAPVRGQYFDNYSPVSGKVLAQVARSTAEDIELALDAAHAAKDAWARTPAADRSRVLLKIADRIEDNLATIALVETLDNGKPIRETTYADIPLMVDHFRYFAGALRAQEGSLSEIDHDTIAYHFHEPPGRSPRLWPPAIAS